MTDPPSGFQPLLEALDTDRELPRRISEDTILAKLVWYRQGGEQSERQWADVRGVLSVQAGRLDRDYMRNWARHLGIDDLLERLLNEEANL